MHPFNLREALLAKHAQHVVLIHFPIALCIAGVTFDFVAYFTKRSALPRPPTTTSSWPRSATVPGRCDRSTCLAIPARRATTEGNTVATLAAGVTSSAMICVIWYVHFRSRRAPEQKLPRYCLAIELVAMGLIALTAHLGGYLSGVNIPS